MKRIAITTGNRRIEYEFRLNRVLIIFCYLPDSELPAFADMLDAKSEIESVEQVRRYDSQLSSIIAKMKVGYDSVKAERQIANAFNKTNHAKPLPICEVQALPQ